jgi:hypothetical protein
MDFRNGKFRVVAMFAVLVLSAHAWAARPQAFTRIDAPGAAVTVASGINGDGFIVGWYCLQTPCNATRFRGFLRDPDGTFHDIVIPSDDHHPAIGTQARYVSPQGVVIGDYVTLEQGATVGNPRFRGFACEASKCYGPDAQITYFDVPSDFSHLYDNPTFAHSIIPRAINPNGDIVGCIHDMNQGDSMHGFYLHDGMFTRLADSMTMNNGLTAAGDIVGLDGGSTTAYHIDSFGNVERLGFPNADATNAWDINAKGEIVGQAFLGAVGHAFLRSKNSEYSFIDPGGALSAMALAIAGNGNVVGQYRDAFGTHGFLLQRGD